MILTEEQQRVVDADSPVLVVLGGAGTGKTTTAAHLVRRVLETAADDGKTGRALLLSFSRSSVTQVLARSADVLQKYAPNVEVTTFHAFAWRLIHRWGNVIGIKDPKLLSSAEKKVFGSANGLGYDDLIPAARRILTIPAVADHLSRRWSVLVVDEFQDTSNEHWGFIQALRGEARLVLLGDLNQCIYTDLPNSAGVGPQRVRAALALTGAERIDLPEASHRDPTQVIPAAANAIRQRLFSHDAVRVAIETGALKVIEEPDPSREVQAVLLQIALMRELGLTVGVFSHHIDSTASLSDGLNAADVEHQVVGLPDSVDAALSAQFAMLRLAAGTGNTDDVFKHLAIFIAACERGANAPELARMVAGQTTGPATLQQRLQSLTDALSAAPNLKDAFATVSEAHRSVGLTRGESSWHSAARVLRALIGPRALAANGFPPAGLDHLRDSVERQHLSLLTYDEAVDAAPVQLMGLYQSKGREADVAIVVVRASDYFGKEREPMPSGSRLLYVLFTRARKKTVVVAIGSPLSSLVAPLQDLT